MIPVVGPQLDTEIVSELPGLNPLAYRSRSLQGIKLVRFAGRMVSGWTRLPNGDSVTVKASLPPNIYDGTSYDLVVRASDLSENFVLTVPAFVVGPNTVSQIAGRVTGSEVVGRPRLLNRSSATNGDAGDILDRQGYMSRGGSLCSREWDSVFFSARGVGRASQSK